MLLIISVINIFENKNNIIFSNLILINDWGWGLGIGDWGLGIGPNPQSPIPNPPSPCKLI